MRAAGVLLVCLACAALALQGCGEYWHPLTGAEARAPTEVQADTQSPDPSLDLRIIKSMLYGAAVKQKISPYVVMGLAWHESGWQASVVSPAGAVGIMQVMPTTAEADGPALLHRNVNLFDPKDNIDLGTAILRSNLDRYNNDFTKALTAYFAGPDAVTDWAHLRADCRRYVRAVYAAAAMFRDGKAPV
jgi:soluble lytic murein transglycosylase-like protein